MMTETQRRALLPDGTTAVAFPDLGPIPLRILRLARRQPAAAAIAGPDGVLTYRELADRAGALAGRLRAAGVGRDTPAALWLDRSPELVIAALAVMLAGGAYVGLDIDEPAARAAAMIADAGAPVIITSGQRSDTVPSGAQIIDVAAAPAGQAPPGVPAGGPAPSALSDLCYITYTSGSTGRPKGVMVQHDGLANLVSWYATTFAVTPADRMPQFARPSFDGWGLEVWPCLASGATLCLPPRSVADSPDGIVQWLSDQRVTVCFLTTALAVEVLRRPWPARDAALRAFLIGGEKLHHYPPADLPFPVYHVYGPTEATMLATCGEMRTDGRRDVSPPIGRPLANMRAYVLDRQGNLAPAGEVGELHLAGVGVARGYLGRADLTAERFRTDPFASPGDGRMYATGDLVRLRHDGQIEFVARLDEQIKLRGFRIEPGEVEAALRQADGVAEAVVVLHDRHVGERPEPGHESASATSRLIAYVRPADAGRAPEPAALREALSRQLPSFMVPHAIVMLGSLPLNRHGKVDRQALALRPLDVQPATPPPDRSKTPRDGLERHLAELWCTVLEIDAVRRDDSFFDLGGDSLQAMRVATRARQQGIRLGAEDLFDHEVLHELAAALDDPAPSEG